METFTDLDQCILSVNDLNVFTNTGDEEGGFALEKEGKFIFVQIDNKNRGLDIGRVLYEPDQLDYIKTLNPHFKEKWKLAASFHTHPSFSVDYSSVDYRFLFQSFPINFIKSIRDKQICRYNWINEEELTAELIYA